MKAKRTWWVTGAVVVGMMISGCGKGPGGEAARAWEEAGAAYGATNYSKAVRLYRKAEELGYAPGALYYNLGNAYYREGQLGKAICAYREGQLGKAICAYRQAAWLLPRDGDVAENLETARRAAHEHIAPRELPATVQAFLFFYFHVSPDESVWLFVIATVALFAGMAIKAFWRTGALRQVVAIGGVLWVVLGIAAGAHSYQVMWPKGAVVVAEQAAVRSGPAAAETTLFELHDGAEVEVLSRAGEWSKIRAAAQKGWMATKDLSMITVRGR